MNESTNGIKEILQAYNNASEAKKVCVCQRWLLTGYSCALCDWSYWRHNIKHYVTVSLITERLR